MKKFYIFPLLGLSSVIPLVFISNFSESENPLPENNLTSREIIVEENQEQKQLDRLPKKRERKELEKCPAEWVSNIPTNFKKVRKLS